MLTLGDRDALNLKRYAKFERGMQAVYVSLLPIPGQRLLRGRVVHASTRSGFCSIFNILENGGSVRMIPRRIPKLTRLPHDVYHDILDYAWNAATPAVFDLDREVVHGLNLSLFAVDRRTRWRTLDYCVQNPTQFVLKMATHDAHTDFNNFERMKYRVSMLSFQRILLYAKPQGNCAPRIIMDFNTARSTPFARLHTNIKELFHLLNDLSSETQVVFRQPVSATNNNEYRCGAQVTWRSLQEATFVLLSGILLQDLSRGQEPLPQLWINGNTQLLHAIYSTSEVMDHQTHYEYSHAQLHASALRTAGYMMAQKLASIWSSSNSGTNLYFFQIIGSTSETMEYVWKTLCLRY